MRTALDLPAEELNAYEQNFVGKLKEFGWFRTGVFGDAEGPGFTYTTGLWLTAAQPELIVFGLKGEVARDLLWDLFRDAEAGHSLPLATRTDQVFGNLSAYAFPVAKRFYAEYLGSSCWFYGGDAFPCLQIVWPDPNDHFPWEEGFDPAFAGDQPDLTENGWRNALPG